MGECVGLLQDGVGAIHSCDGEALDHTCLDTLDQLWQSGERTASVHPGNVSIYLLSRAQPALTSRRACAVVRWGGSTGMSLP